MKMTRVIMLMVLTLAVMMTTGCSETTNIVCPEPLQFYEVTSIAYQGHTAMDKVILPEDEFLRVLHNVKFYYERFEEEVWGSPMFFEFRNINTMTYPKVLCREGRWVICNENDVAVGGVDPQLWCVDTYGIYE